MGARGHDAFSNDHALDGVDGLLAAGDTGPVQGALAAAEIVAAVRGKPGADLPKKLVAWQAGKSRPSDALLELARRAVAKVMQDSELKDLWVESGNPQAWEDGVKDLQARLL